ncbi:MAG: pyruvate kinase [Acholeplasmataceae bacterium]
MRKTKIVGTCGPASENRSTLRQLILSGVNVVRNNYSHGDHDEHIHRFKLVHELNEELGTYVGTMMDTKGPEIRTHHFKDSEAYIRQGQSVTIHMDEILGDDQAFSVTYSNLFDDVEVGTTLLIDDGYLALLVIEKDKETRTLITVAKNSHMIKNRRGINVPNTILNMPFLSPKDILDIKFACHHNYDYIAASFTRRKEDVLAIRDLLQKEGKDYIKIIAKIENQEGIDNIDDIIDAADGIVVARGDLGVEVFAEDLPQMQKSIVTKCQQKGKLVIVATQMLESMQENPRPTRAEVSDVANAVYDGTDATMLSGEMAQGRYPIESVDYMAKITEKAEKHVDHRKFTEHALQEGDNLLDAISFAAVQAAIHYNVKAIIAYGYKATDNLSKYRSIAPIIGVVDSYHKATSLSLFYGVFPVIGEDELERRLKSLGVKQGDTILVVHKYRIEFISYTE